MIHFYIEKAAITFCRIIQTMWDCLKSGHVALILYDGFETLNIDDMNLGFYKSMAILE